MILDIKMLKHDRGWMIAVPKVMSHLVNKSNISSLLFSHVYLHLKANWSEYERALIDEQVYETTVWPYISFLDPFTPQNPTTDWEGKELTSLSLRRFHDQETFYQIHLDDDDPSSIFANQIEDTFSKKIFSTEMIESCLEYPSSFRSLLQCFIEYGPAYAFSTFLEKSCISRFQERTKQGISYAFRIDIVSIFLSDSLDESMDNCMEESISSFRDIFFAVIHTSKGVTLEEPPGATLESGDELENATVDLSLGEEKFLIGYESLSMSCYPLPPAHKNVQFSEHHRAQNARKPRNARNQRDPKRIKQEKDPTYIENIININEDLKGKEKRLDKTRGDIADGTLKAKKGR